jgi:copper chaperone CopZ
MTRDNVDANASTDDRLSTARLPIARLNCSWHAGRIAEYLERVEGVVEASLEPRSDTVVVRYDPARTSETAITAAIEQMDAGGGRDAPRSRSGRGSSGCHCGCRNRSR